MLKKTDYLPGMMLTGTNEDADIANALGMVFRNIPAKVTLSNGQVLVYRFDVNVKTKLLARVLQAISGHVRYEVIVNATETAAGTPVTLSCTNNDLATVPANSMQQGVTITGGQVIDVVEVLTGQGGNSSSLPDSQVGGRTLAANSVFWLRLTGVTASSCLLYLLLREFQQ